MKTRLALLAAGSAALFMVGAAPASADNGVHIKDAGVIADGCAGCHRTHTADASGLLTSAMPGLCLTCHGTTGTGAKTDVMSGLGYSGFNPRPAGPGALRGGGFASARISSALPSDPSTSRSNANGIVPVLTTPVDTTSSHTIDGTTGTAWGNGAINTSADTGKAIGLTCGSCHDPHGNGNYRILKPVPTDSGGTSTPITDVPLPGGVTDPNRVYTTTNYWKVDDVTAANGYIGSVSAWCTTCHTRYKAPSGSGSTASGDAIFSYRHRSDGQTQGSASCIQCHVSHGSNAAMGVQSAAAASNNPGSATATGSSRLLRIDNRGTCQMCHNK